MKKHLIPFLLISFVIVGCNSKEEKAAELIKKELYKTLYDFDSYSPIALIPQHFSLTFFIST